VEKFLFEEEIVFFITKLLIVGVIAIGSALILTGDSAQPPPPAAPPQLVITAIGHISNIGDENARTITEGGRQIIQIGDPNRNERLEGVRIRLEMRNPNGSVTSRSVSYGLYSLVNENTGVQVNRWIDSSNFGWAGSAGSQHMRNTAFRINDASVEYRVHQNGAWSQWRTNGEIATNSVDFTNMRDPGNIRIRAIQIRQR
jgi:hypothetical protein